MDIEKIYMQKGNYTLLKLANVSYQPYVVAYKFNKSDNTWNQGHYFEIYGEARLFFREKTSELD